MSSHVTGKDFANLFFGGYGILLSVIYFVFQHIWAISQLAMQSNSLQWKLTKLKCLLKLHASQTLIQTKYLAWWTGNVRARQHDIKICVKSPQYSLLTHGEKPPHHWRGGEACKDIVGAGKVCEVRQHYRLAPALAPHVHLTTLGLSSRCVCGVTGGDFHNPVKETKGEN